MALLLLLVFFLTSCNTAEDLYPKSYGDWDGNYVYISNYRMKTTGEEFSVLIDYIEIDGKVYDSYYKYNEEIKGLNVVDYFYYENNIYLILEYGVKKGILVKYDTYNKNYQIFYHFDLEAPYYGFFKLFKDSFLFGGNNTLIHIDYQGNIIDENAIRYFYDYIYFQDYMFLIENGNIKMSFAGVENFEVIYESPNELKHYPITLDLINDKLYIYYQTFAIEYDKAFSVVQCDINTKEVVPIYVSTTKEYTGAKVLSNQYFMTYKLTRVKGAYGISELLRLENKLYKIKSNGKHELLYTFKENQDFLYKVEFVGNSINFTSFHYARRNIFESELETKLSISFQFKIEKTISMAVSKKHKEPSKIDQGIRVDDYIYYEDIKYYGSTIKVEYFYFLMRHNVKTKKTDTMFYVQKGIKTSISSNDAIDVFASKESESKRKLLILPY